MRDVVEDAGVGGSVMQWIKGKGEHRGVDFRFRREWMEIGWG